MSHYPLGSEMPVGLGMTLAQNLEAMNRFASMTPKQQQAFIAHAHGVRSKAEMQAYVQSLLH